jgi:hypothetical protein
VNAEHRAHRFHRLLDASRQGAKTYRDNAHRYLPQVAQRALGQGPRDTSLRSRHGTPRSPLPNPRKNSTILLWTCQLGLNIIGR